MMLGNLAPRTGYLLATPQVFEREFGVLQEIKDNHPKMVLSLDTRDFGSEFSGIKRKNLIDWLLED